MPTTPIHTFTNQGLVPFYDHANALAYGVKLQTGTYVKGTVLGEVTATPGTFKAYAAGNSDGSENPKSLLQFDTTVDASGNHMVGGGEFGETKKYAPAFFTGTFKTTDLTGLDANAVTKLGRLINGSVADGVLRIG